MSFIVRARPFTLHCIAPFHNAPLSTIGRWCSPSAPLPCALLASARLQSGLGGGGDEGDSVTAFSSRPISERAAAMAVARLRSGTRVDLKAFVEHLPKVSRDDIFGRGMRVEDWVRESVLLRLVVGEDGLQCIELTVEPEPILAGDGGGKKTCQTSPRTSEHTHSEGEGGVDVEEEDAGKFLELLRDEVLGRREEGMPNYKLLNEAYSLLLRKGSMRRTSSDALRSLKYVQFLRLLETPRGVAGFWVLHGKYVCSRLPGETQPPRFVSPQPQTMSANPMNAYGGWGAAANVPTREDVYEILKYVPVNWGNFGNLNLPPAVKKRHIRIASTLQWFRRQPYYFELRNVAGTTEIRRSVVLHPEAHGLTPEDAHEQLQLKIAKGEANSLAPLSTEGELLSPTAASQQTAALLKFITRVCPGYFVPPSLIMQRYTKKSLTQRELVECASSHSSLFEVIRLKYTDTPLLRKRIGVDSARWRDGFIEDFERHPEDARCLIILMDRVCTTWDRPHYVYVRLTEEERMLVGGFEGMMQVLRRHPRVFRVGENFIARADLSDTLSAQETEPRPDDMTTRTIIREENPYQTPRELAVVFHYVAPDDEPCSASFLLQCASPAMRAVLPPRIVALLQGFPDLFVCKETAPGVFLMRKVKKNNVRRSVDFPAERTQSQNTSRDDTSPTTQDNAGSSPGDALDLDAEFAESDFLSREEAVEAVKTLIPAGGVEASQLLLWASIGVQQAANRHYGGVLKLVEANRKHFRVQDTQEAKLVFLAESSAPEV
ncbi:hypothetical protein ERJ75_000141100 [Trypanosoma vivax]|nr:hypothetical protein ERJ75_000141100 [Trypanosoma vivax]